LVEVIDQSNHGFQVVGSEGVTGTRRPEGFWDFGWVGREVSTMVYVSPKVQGRGQRIAMARTGPLDLWTPDKWVE
jgi:hypothetical protein